MAMGMLQPLPWHILTMEAAVGIVQRDVTPLDDKIDLL